MSEKKKGGIIKLNENTTVKMLEELVELAKEGKIKNVLACGDTCYDDYYVAYAGTNSHDKYRFVGYIQAHNAVETMLMTEYEELD